MAISIVVSAGAVVALAIWIAGAIFGAGGLKARVESLEKWQTHVDQIIEQGGLVYRIKSLEDWRVSMRVDMHEISDILGRMDKHLARLDERVEALLKLRKAERP